MEKTQHNSNISYWKNWEKEDRRQLMSLVD